MAKPVVGLGRVVLLAAVVAVSLLAIGEGRWSETGVASAQIADLADFPYTSPDAESAGTVTPSVTVARQGRFLKLNCDLLNENGVSPTHRNYTYPPEFVVFKDDREIGSGTFEYG